MWLWNLIGLSIIIKVHGYSGGFFPQSCESMSPMHEKRRGQYFGPQNTQPPYEVRYQHGKEGEPIKVFLQSKESTEFRGFMLEARKKGMVDEGRPVGKFIVLDSETTRTLKCSHLEDSAVSQENNQKKTLIQVNWTAERAELDITFRATFVKSIDTFWERVDVNVTLPPHTTPPPLPPSTQPSTTTSTEPSTITSTTEPSTTSTGPITTTSTTEPSTTSTTEPSTTSSTTLNDTQKESRTFKQVTVPMIFDTVFVGLKLELPNIVTTPLKNSHFLHRLNKGLKLSCSLLCAAVEISAVVLFCVGDSFEVTLVALVCVVIAINVVELVIVSLPIGPSHELKEICDLAVKVCSVIHAIFTIAVVFIGVLKIDNCSKNRKESWLLKVMVTYLVWIFLFVIWVFVFSTHRKAILGRRKTGSSKNTERWRQQRKEKKLSAAEGIATAVSVILVVGNMSFAVAVIVGISGCQEK
ncbi:cell wall integrity and stress response component 3-like isoform X2 [Siniperca chuatsi]|uniref:cell wall integrity and stress response component 3-like isoform X2 n=1 Tax=Siniperca chuatsi TaxID=119488 RepID=UPI001CE0E2A5|nr:cell wall integrity and stress response component 3-like isoform X2 [Siniperca chuatsi]